MKVVYSVFNKALAVHNIRLALEVKKLTQQELALLAGISPATVCKILNGERGFSLDSYLRFKNALDLPLDYGLTNMDINSYETYLKYYNEK